MYNSDQKIRYMNNCRFENTTIDLIEKIFNATQLEEEQYGKDLVEFNQIEVTDLLKSFNSKSPQRLRSNCFYLNDYYLWCYNEGLVESIINPYEKDIIDAIVDDIIPIEQLCGRFFSKEDVVEVYMPNILDVSNKFILYASFYGIKMDELINLKMSDLNYDNHTVTLINGRIIKVDSLFINLMVDTNDQTQYFEDGIEKESNFNKYDYIQTEYVIKTCSTRNVKDIVNSSYIIHRLSVIKKQAGNDYISSSTIYNNGLINYVKERYEEQGISIKTALYQRINQKLYTYDKQTAIYIKEYGSKKTVRILRMEVNDYIDIL